VDDKRSDDKESAALDLAIEHAREESKLVDARRQRWDGAAVGLVTGATALGALLVTAARSLDAATVPELAAQLVFVTLALTIVAAVLSRITWFMKFSPKHRDAKREEAAAISVLRGLVGAGYRLRTFGPRDTAGLQLAIQRRWTARARCGESSLRWQRAWLMVGAVMLVASIGILGFMARSALERVWP